MMDAVRQNVIPPVQKILGWRLFSRAEGMSGVFDIIKWWELRRIPYNLVIGIVGIFTLAAVIAVATIASRKFNEPMGWPDPPIFALCGIVAYGICANICFTGGWIIEIVVRKIWLERAGAFAEISFCLGLVFSIFLTLVPAILFSLLLILRVLLHDHVPPKWE